MGDLGPESSDTRLGQLSSFLGPRISGGQTLNNKGGERSWSVLYHSHPFITTYIADMGTEVVTLVVNSLIPASICRSATD